MMSPRAPHPAHCRQCKPRIRELLLRLFDDCVTSYAFGWSSRPETYAGSQVGAVLHRIFRALCTHRGYRDFIRTPAMPPCDYYVRRAGFIVEFDETQHFTRPRLITLRCYPAHQRVGFDLREWMRLCELLDCADPTPPDRDERRAWYDCLRDLLPVHYGLQPTIRLYASAFPWCALRPNASEDLARFESLLGVGGRRT